MVRRLHGPSALIGLAMALVPVAYFGPLSLNGVPIVEGCSIPGPVGTGVLSISVPQVATGALSVGLDGFFALDVRTNGITAEEALAALTVEVVVSSTAVPVVGSLAILQSQNAGSDGQVIVGFSSATPLVPGQDLSVSVSANGWTSDQVEGFAMRTGADSADLVVPPLVASPFERVTYDVGELITCDLSFNGCGLWTGVGAETRELYETNLTIGSTLQNAVAWEVSVAEVDGNGTFTDLAPWPLILLYGGESGFRLKFAEQRDEYCVNVVVRDLRSGEELSEEYCTSPVEPVDVSLDRMMYCVTPPSPELNARWCAAKGLDADCEPMPSGESGSCSIARPNGKTGAPAALLAALALFLVGRRRETRRL